MLFSTLISDAVQPPPPVRWRYVATILLVWFLLLLSPAVMNIVVDPCQVFHKSWFKHVFFYKDNERFQGAGLIRNYLAPDHRFDGVIVGSSISANITSQDIRSTLGWNGLNLSVRASGLTERYFILQHALATGRVRHVLLELYAADVDETAALLDEKASFPFYLYSDRLLDKFPYVFNLSILQASLMLLQQNDWLPSLPAGLQKFLVLDPAIWGEKGVEAWSVWMQDAGHMQDFERFNRPDNLLRKRREIDAVRQQYQGQLQSTHDYPFAIQQLCIVDLVRAHPDIAFDIWFAPVSLARYASEPDPQFIDRNVALRRFVVTSLASASNVRVFGFDNELSITGDLRNYLDYSHFSPRVQDWVLREVGQGHHRLTVENIDSYAEQFRRNVMDFDIAVPASNSAPTTINQTP
ncbi:MAG TPA: hypothetical protein PLF22_05665 [Pseudomonadales bacterium]|nr:hypothetical protein [Pseudomonadales bacterium]